MQNQQRSDRKRQANVNDEDFQIRKRADTTEYIRKMEASNNGASAGSPPRNSDKDIRSDDAENFSDPAFDSELAQFKMHLDKTLDQQGAISRRQRKLRPNVSPRWLSIVRERLELLQLKSFKQNFSSPRTSTAKDDELYYDEDNPEVMKENQTLDKNKEKEGRRETSITTQSTATNNGGAAAPGRQPAPFMTSSSYASQINLERISVRFSHKQRSA